MNNERTREQLKDAVINLCNQCDDGVTALRALVDASFEVANSCGVTACRFAVINMEALAHVMGVETEWLLNHIKEEHL